MDCRRLHEREHDRPCSFRILQSLFEECCHLLGSAWSVLEINFVKGDRFLKGIWRCWVFHVKNRFFIRMDDSFGIWFESRLVVESILNLIYSVWWYTRLAMVIIHLFRYFLLDKIIKYNTFKKSKNTRRVECWSCNNQLLRILFEYYLESSVLRSKRLYRSYIISWRYPYFKSFMAWKT